VHCNDILPRPSLCESLSDDQRLCLLATVDSIEDVAVMNDEARPEAARRQQLHQHHVKAENLHVPDALAAITLQLDGDIGPIFSRRYHKPPRLFVEIAGNTFDSNNSLSQLLTAIVLILL